MNENYQQLKELFQAALERPADDRTAFLDQACPEPALRAEVDELLTAHEQTSYLDAAALLPDALLDEAALLPSTAEEPMTGQRIGPYKTLRELGQGGMGTVFLARRDDDQFKKRVAIKLIRRGMNTDSIIRRFRHERQILASLDHPNIARLLDGGATEDGLPYLVLEYVEGQPIDEYCDRHQLSTIERLDLFRKVSGAVHYAHQNLVVHRDLKPGNILVAPPADGKAGTPKLLDFGIAKILNPEISGQTIDPTLTAMKLMTPGYASPEQIRGEAITTASDVYSLGVILYELLTGHRPYHVSTRAPHEIARVICEVEPPKPSVVVTRAEVITGSDGSEKATITPEQVSRARNEPPEKLRRRLAGDLDNIVLMALRKEPQRRYTSVEQFSEDLRRYLDGLTVAASRDTFTYRSTKFVRRHKAGVTALATIALLIVGSVVTLAIQSARLARERDKAEQVSEFLVNMFETADPYKARGKEITAREILDKGAQRVATELGDQPEARALLMNAMGNSFTHLGLYDQAAPLLDHALEIRRNILGNESLDTAKSLDGLGTLLIGKGDFARAEKLLREALQIRRKRLGGEHPEVAASLNNLGQALLEKGSYAAAEPLFREALAINRKLLGNNHTSVAVSLNNLGRALHHQENYAAAEPMYREALAISRRLLGNEHPDVINELLNLAWLFRDRSDYTTADPLNREALAISRKLFGNEHPQVASCLLELGDVQRWKEDYVMAESLYREALAINRKVLSNDNPYLAENLNSLGVLLFYQRDYAAAELVLQEALEILRKLPDQETTRVATTLSNLGRLFYRKGDYSRAEPYLREVVSLRRKLLGNEHSATATGLNNLANVISKKRDYVTAESLYREALAIHHKLYGEENMEVANIYYALAFTFSDKRDYPAAEQNFSQAMALYRKLEWSEHADVALCLYHLGRLSLEQQNYARAEELSRQALQIQRKTLPAGHADLVSTLLVLGQALTKKGEAANAEPMLREGLEIRRKTLPQDDWRIASAESALGDCLAALHRYKESEPLLLRSYPVIKTRQGEEHPTTREALRRVVALYEAWGKPDRAARFRKLLPQK
ncbi:MAG: serine/threonine-protein kinase [Acidobacteriota bacterium]